jgi:hypothetical protein
MEGLDVTVVPGGLNDFTVPMALANGDVVSRIEFRHSFAGEPLCSVAGVATINSQVVDETGIAIAGANTPCVDGLVGVDGVRSKGEHTLEVEGLDADGNVRFVGRSDVKGLQPGETKFLGTIEFEPASGDVTVRFSFEGERFCAAAGVDNIDAQLIDGEGRVEQGQNIDCILGNVVFTDVPVGTYALHVDALDANNLVQYTTDVRDVEIGAADVDLGVVNLEALASTVRVRFRLPDDLTCAEAGVDAVDIQIVDGDGNVTGANVPCINGDSGDLVGPAPGRVDVRVQGLSGGVAAFDGSEGGVLIRGGANSVEVELVAVTTTLELSWSFATVNVNDVEQQPSPVPIEALTTRCVDADVDTVNIRVLQGRRRIANLDTASISFASLIDADLRGAQLSQFAFGYAEITGSIDDATAPPTPCTVDGDQLSCLQ